MASKNKRFVGKEFIHETLGRVRVLKAVPRTRVKVEVELVDRGAGWDDIEENYKGIRKGNGWMRAENKQFGFRDEVSITKLSKIE